MGANDIAVKTAAAKRQGNAGPLTRAQRDTNWTDLDNKILELINTVNALKEGAVSATGFDSNVISLGALVTASNMTVLGNTSGGAATVSEQTIVTDLSAGSANNLATRDAIKSYIDTQIAVANASASATNYIAKAYCTITGGILTTEYQEGFSTITRSGFGRYDFVFENEQGKPQLDFSIAGGTQATGTVNLSGGTIAGISVDNQGNGYTDGTGYPLTLIGGNPSAAATATFDVSGGKVTAINVTGGGAGYGRAVYTVAALREWTQPLEGAIVIYSNSGRSTTGFTLVSSNDNSLNADPAGINVLVF